MTEKPKASPKTTVKSTVIAGVIVTAVCLYELYLAWANHVVLMPIKWRPPIRLSLSGEPYEFRSCVAFYVAMLVAWWVFGLALIRRKFREDPSLEQH